MNQMNRRSLCQWFRWKLMWKMCKWSWNKELAPPQMQQRVAGRCPNIRDLTPSTSSTCSLPAYRLPWPWSGMLKTAQLVPHVASPSCCIWWKVGWLLISYSFFFFVIVSSFCIFVCFLICMKCLSVISVLPSVAEAIMVKILWLCKLPKLKTLLFLLCVLN